MGGVQKAGHFFGCFAFDAHGQAKRAHFQVSHGAVQHLTHEVGGLRPRRASARPLCRDRSL
jgi:hypothetical protein